MIKKILCLLITLLPLCAFAQSYTEDNSTAIGGLIIFSIALGISIGIFLLLRQVLLWYWKVELALQKQDEQIQILRSIYNSLEENNRLTKAQIELVIGKVDQEG